MESSIRSHPARTGLTVLLLLGVLVAVPTPARACSCAPRPPVEESIASSEWVFIGRQIEQRDVGNEEGSRWGPVRLEIEVLAVYKGDVPQRLELRTGRGGGDCGVSFANRGEVGFMLTPNDDGLASIGSCGGSVDPDELRLRFEPVPGGYGTGPPGFLVGLDVGPSRIALLDRSGRLLTYAEGDGRLAAAAVCPGGQKYVEVVEAGPGWTEIGGEDLPTVEVRDGATLQIESVREIPIERRDRSQLNGMGWVFDLTCHDPDGDLVTYLLPQGVWDAYSGANLPGPATLHVWRGEELSEVAAGEARAVAVDATAGRFYAVTGADGRTLETRDLSGAVLEAFAVPREHVGWRLALSDDGTELAVLARRRPMDEINWFFADVNRLLLIDLATGKSTTHPLPTPGFALVLEAQDGTYAVAVAIAEPPGFQFSRLTGDEMELVAATAGGGFRTALAAGPGAVVLGSNGEMASDAVRIDTTTGETSPIHGLGDLRLAITIPDGAPIPIITGVTTTTTSTTSTTTAPVTTTTLPTPSSDPGDDPATSLPPVTTVADPEDPTTAAWPVVVGIGAALALAAIGVLVLLRRERLKAGDQG